MPEFLQNIVDFLTANLVWVILIAVAAVAVIVLIIILAVKAKRKKRRKAEDAALSNAPRSESAPAAGAAANTEEEVVYEGTPLADQNAPAAAEKQTAAQDKTDPHEEEPVSVVEKSAEEKPAVQNPAAENTTVVVKKPAKTAAKKPTRRPSGKWVIEHKGAGEYSSKLCASNGEVMLTSEVYSTEDGARAGIATIVKAAETGEFVIYRDKKDNFYYKLKSANNRLLCVGEIYKSKDQCEKAVESVKRIAPFATVSDEVAEGAKYVTYTPAPLGENELRRGARGKWRIEPTEEGRFSAKLYANNGQLMLATEEVSSLKRANDAKDAVKRNAAEGNFIIDRDKFGRYYYKLRNSQKSVICIGEAYDKLDSCVSAIESVRRFAATSE